MTSCLVAINKNRDMCFDMKNGKKTYFSGEIPVNDGRNVWRALKSIRLIKKKILRISKVSCKESSRSQSLKEFLNHFHFGYNYKTQHYCSIVFKSINSL